MHRRLLTIIAGSFFFFACFTFASAEESLSQVGEAWKPSPTGAALRSLLVPGWGQMYAGHPLKAVVYSGIELAFIHGIYRQHCLYRHYSDIGEDNTAEAYRNDRNRQGWYLAASVIVAVMDAYVDAHLYRFDVSEQLSSVNLRGGFLGTGVNVVFSWRFY